MKLGVVMPIGPGREDNVALALRRLADQTARLGCVVAVLDGDEVQAPPRMDKAIPSLHMYVIRVPKHEPGMEQPRNHGVRVLRRFHPELTHVAFLDSDIIVGTDWACDIIEAYLKADLNRVMACPYDWLPLGERRMMHELRNDPRWARFNESSDSSIIYREDIGAGLACFSGNLVWPIDEFIRVGGFWSEIHHGRCEDGELGLRAVAMDVGISFCREARGWHLWHPVNMALALERNKRDVPMLNQRHPWVEGSGVLMVDRDGKAFDVLCPTCKQMIPTIAWWDHALSHNTPSTIPAKV